MIFLFKSFFKRTASTPFFYFVLALFVINSSYIAYMMVQIFSIYPKILDAEMFGYSAETVHHVFNSYGEKGMSYYKKFQMGDIIYPISVFLFSGSLLYKVYKEEGSLIYILPFIAMTTDYCENYFLWNFRESYPLIENSWVSKASVLSIVKHFSIVLMIFFIFKKIFIKNK